MGKIETINWLQLPTPLLSDKHAHFSPQYLETTEADHTATTTPSLLVESKHRGGDEIEQIPIVERSPSTMKMINVVVQDLFGQRTPVSIPSTATVGDLRRCLHS